MSANGVEELAEICPVAAPMSEAGSGLCLPAEAQNSDRTGRSGARRSALLVCPLWLYKPPVSLQSDTSKGARTGRRHTVLAVAGIRIVEQPSCRGGPIEMLNATYLKGTA